MEAFVVTVVGNEYRDSSSNPGWDSISHIINTLGKGMNRIIFPPVSGNDCLYFKTDSLMNTNDWLHIWIKLEVLH